MLDRTLRSWLVALVAVLGVVVGSGPAHAGGKNAIRAIAIADDQGTTTIRAQGADTPTFTVYKLERPTRVVIDIARPGVRGYGRNRTERSIDSASLLTVLLSIIRPTSTTSGMPLSARSG